MNPSIASLVCAVGIAGLLYLDRENTARNSKALWLPGIWLGIVGSRSVSQWFGVTLTENVQVDGSPVDAAVFAVLLLIAIGVLIRRSRLTRLLLRANWQLVVYFAFCLISIAWSYHPDVAFKRWVKAIGDLAMALIIATDKYPVQAVRRLASRLGMLLFPVSILFIQYYGDLGRGYTSDGLRMNTGVTTNKNALGLIVLVVSLVVVWNVRYLLIHKSEPNRGRRLLAQGTLLVFGLALFWMADCSTGKACFVLGAVLMIALDHRAIRGRPARVHALCTLLFAVAVGIFLGGQAEVASALGRQSNLSGRTEIWEAVIPAVPNSMVGAGFESFWISPNVQIFQRTLLASNWYSALVKDLNEAHNGYIEVYLNLGWIGLSLIALIVIGGYRRSCVAFQQDHELGSLFIAYIAILTAYSATEAGFRMLSPSWIFMLIAIVMSSGIGAGLFQIGKNANQLRRSPLTKTAFDELLPELKPAHSNSSLLWIISE